MERNKTMRDLLASVWLSGGTSSLNAQTATATDLLASVVDTSGAIPALNISTVGGVSGGTSGTDGTSGSSGIDGTSGTDGTSGSSGIDGTSGTDGTSGIDGTSGTDGTSGSSGIDGIDAVPVTITTYTGTTYTLVIGDADEYLRINNAAAITVTVPTNASVAFDIGTVVTFEQTGAGAVTISSSATLNGEVNTDTQYEIIQIVKTATDAWTVIGGKA